MCQKLRFLVQMLTSAKTRACKCHKSAPKIGGENQSKRGVVMQHRIVFEDHGQDFLEWDVKDGVVAECRPFQGFIWNGTKVDMTQAAEGQLLPIVTKRGTRMVIKYPVAAMSRI